MIRKLYHLLSIFLILPAMNTVSQNLAAPVIHWLLNVWGLASLQISLFSLEDVNTFPMVKSTSSLPVGCHVAPPSQWHSLLPCHLGSALTVLFLSACWVPPVLITGDSLASSPLRLLLQPISIKWLSSGISQPQACVSTACVSYAFPLVSLIPANLELVESDSSDLQQLLHSLPWPWSRWTGNS